MDLELDLTRTRGRAQAPLAFQVIGELDRADLALLEIEKGSSAPPLKALRDSHHKLARVLASGAKPAEASLATGYSLSRISILQADPAFKELMETYRQGVQEEFEDFTKKMSAIASSAADMLLEKMETEDLTVNQLLEVTKTFADRSGHGPQSKSTNVNVNVDLAGRLEAARRRAAIGVRSDDPLLIEGSPALES